MTRQWSGTDTIEFHILPQTPYLEKEHKQLRRHKVKQHKRKVKRSILSQQISTRNQQRLTESGKLWHFWEQRSAEPGAMRREGCRICHCFSWTDSIKPSLPFSNFGCCISKGSLFRLFRINHNKSTALEGSVIIYWGGAGRKPVLRGHNPRSSFCCGS